jgi:cytochrome P450
MMTVEGERHYRYKRAHQSFFVSPMIRDTMARRIRQHVDSLIDGFEELKAVEMRAAFATRLPVLTMLSLFGLSLAEEAQLRKWYDSFEKALSNFTWDEDIRSVGKQNAAHFLALIQNYLDAMRLSPEAGEENTLLVALLAAPKSARLSDAEICRNALIIFFGGISTVEALILNTLYALSLNPKTLLRVREDAALIPNAINETVRWLGPVQSATRHVERETEFGELTFKKGDTVNCMLASANHDPAVFEAPEIFDIDRNNLQQQIGFAVGPHHCLGSRLARAEARIALQQLFARLPGFRLDLDRVAGPQGYEFRQPTAAVAVWK